MSLTVGSIMLKNALFIGALLGAAPACANVVINATRVIYQEASKDVIVQLINNGDSASLIQAWIDAGDMNSTPETAKVPFLLSPPVVKVAANGGQQLRIKKTGPSLPGDRESVFYLNVLDIPPIPENLEGKNTLQLAVKSRIKLFYRPQGLTVKPDAIADYIALSLQGGQLMVKNNSPYHFTLANIDKINKKNVLKDAIMVAPFSSAPANVNELINANERVFVKYVDDLGAYKEKIITPH